MTTDNEELARTYVRAVSDKDWEAVERLLSPTVELTAGPNRTHSREDFMAALQRVAPVLIRNDIRNVVSDNESAGVLYDFVSRSTAGAVLSFEQLTIVEGVITASLLMFDGSRWPEVVAALQAHKVAP